MATHIICIIILVLSAIALGIGIGGIYLCKYERKVATGERRAYWESKRKDYEGIAAGASYVFIGILIMLIWTYNSFLAPYYIDGYRSGEIIEQVEHKYDIVNGERILKDTEHEYHWVKNKN